MLTARIRKLKINSKTREVDLKRSQGLVTMLKAAQRRISNNKEIKTKELAPSSGSDIVKS